MAATFVHDGVDIDYTPTADVAAGDVVVVGTGIVGVARVPIAANELGALAVQGVFDFPKASGASTAITVGTAIYWDAGNGVATASNGGGSNPRIGTSVLAAGDNDTEVRVLMLQS